MAISRRCPSCQKDFSTIGTATAPVRCPFCQADLAVPGGLTLGGEHSIDAAMHFSATLACLQDVEWLETGGFRDAVAGVVGRYRESFRTTQLQAPRPRGGVLDLPCTCPSCGHTIRLRVKGRFRTALPYLLGTAALGLGVAVLGWLNVPSVGNIALGVTAFGLLLACVPPLLLFVSPSLLDNPTAAFQIVEDVPRAVGLFIRKGPQPPKSKYRELLALGRNQHKLDSVRPVPS
jgi:hypothetical protein